MQAFGRAGGSREKSSPVRGGGRLVVSNNQGNRTVWRGVSRVLLECARAACACDAVMSASVWASRGEKCQVLSHQ